MIIEPYQRLHGLLNGALVAHRHLFVALLAILGASSHTNAQNVMDAIQQVLPASAVKYQRVDSTYRIVPADNTFDSVTVRLTEWRKCEAHGCENETREFWEDFFGIETSSWINPSTGNKAYAIFNFARNVEIDVYCKYFPGVAAPANFYIVQEFDCSKVKKYRINEEEYRFGISDVAIEVGIEEQLERIKESLYSEYIRMYYDENKRKAIEDSILQKTLGSDYEEDSLGLCSRAADSTCSFKYKSGVVVDGIVTLKGYAGHGDYQWRDTITLGLNEDEESRMIDMLLRNTCGELDTLYIRSGSRPRWGSLTKRSNEIIPARHMLKATIQIRHWESKDQFERRVRLERVKNDSLRLLSDNKLKEERRIRQTKHAPINDSLVARYWQFKKLPLARFDTIPNHETGLIRFSVEFEGKGRAILPSDKVYGTCERIRLGDYANVYTWQPLPVKGGGFPERLEIQNLPFIIGLRRGAAVHVNVVGSDEVVVITVTQIDR